jgi:hypothetical protein
MAERKGFEPLKGFDSFNGLANRRLQPLGHLSGLKKKIDQNTVEQQSAINSYT